jgi:hypothetical protein
MGAPRARARVTIALPLVLAAAAAVALNGCGTATTFDEPEPPEAEIAVLEGYFHYYLVAFRSVTITSVDGKAPRATGSSGDITRVALAPGRHSIALRLGESFGDVGSVQQCAFEAHFDIGHRYRIETFDSSASEAEIALQVTTTFGGSSTSRSIPCRRIARQR